MSSPADQLNIILEDNCPIFNALFTVYGKQLFFPKGIVSQSFEAKQQAHLYNATIGVATAQKKPMYLEVLRKYFTHDLSSEEIFPYASAYGLPKLRQLWQQHQHANNSTITTSSLPVVTNALTHGLSLCGDLFVNPGDPIIMPSMYWGNYRLIWQVRKQAQLVPYQLFDNNCLQLDLDSFASTIKKYWGKKFIVLINFPNNPSGYSPTPSEVQKIMEILHTAAQHGSKVLAICDDAYAGLVYEKDYFAQSLFGQLAQLHTNLAAIKIDGCSKEFFAWGLRLGFLTFGNKQANQEVYQVLEEKAAAAVRANVSNVNHPIQSIVSLALQDDNYRKELTAKRQVLVDRYYAAKAAALDPKVSDCWQAYPFNSGYFMTLRLVGVNAEKVRQSLLREDGIGTVSLNSQDLRVAYSSLEKQDIGAFFRLIAARIRKLQAV